MDTPRNTASGGDRSVRATFKQQLDRVYQRAVRMRAAAANMTEVADAMRAKLASIDPVSLDDEHAPMAALARRLNLDRKQRELLWTIVASSFDPRIVPHVETLGGEQARRGLSLTAYALLADLDDDAIHALAEWLASASNPLVSTGLLVITEHASLAARGYAASSRLVSFLAGTDQGIEPVRIVRASRPLLHDLRQAQAIEEIAAALERSAESLLVIEGPIGSGRATACACATGGDLIVLDCDRIGSESLADGLTALWRETLLRPALPVIANADHLIGEEQPDARRLLGDFIDRMAGPLVVTATVPGTDLGTVRPILRIPWKVPDSDVRARLWSAAVHSTGASLKGDVATLAFRYQVGPAAIERAVASVRLFQPPGAAIDESALAAGLRHNIAERLGGLARRVEVTQTWDDLVIADDIGDLIAALIGRVRDAHHVLDRWGYRSKIARGTGVPALFSGPPGTGKTMVAGLIARELDLELYQVDLSKVVSKWVGETEKNLARVFDAAEEGHALLLFDEADALFGRRSSDMKSANDRYANLEVNYLLQRVEAFGGITILTTNLDAAIDPALKRRLAGHVVFAMPDEDERTELWKRHCTTAEAPLAPDVDFAELASEFPKMSGANIRNAALAAAFLAARDKSPTITRWHLIRAARAEYRSMGHVLAEMLAPQKPGRSL